MSFAVSRFTGGYLLFLFCRNGFFTFDCFGGNGFFNFLLSFFSSFLSPFLSFAVFLFFLLSFRFSFFPLFCGFFSHHLSFFLSFPLFVFPFSVFPSLFLPFSFFSRLWYLCRFVLDSVWQRFGFRPFFLFAGFGAVCRFSLLAKTSLFSALFLGPGRDGRTETPFFCKVFLPVHDRQTDPRKFSRFMPMFISPVFLYPFMSLVFSAALFSAFAGYIGKNRLFRVFHVASFYTFFAV